MFYNHQIGIPLQVQNIFLFPVSRVDREYLKYRRFRRCSAVSALFYVHLSAGAKLVWSEFVVSIVP